MPYTLTEQVLNAKSQGVGASETDTAVSNEFSINQAQSEVLVVAVTASAVTSTTGITANLQSSYDDGDSWVDSDDDSAAVAITVDGTIHLYHYADASSKPLGPLVRVTITSGASDAATIDSVLVSQRD